MFMKNSLMKVGLGSVLLLVGAPLMAQTSQSPAPASEPSAPAASTAPSSFSDEDLKQFAAAAVAVNQVQSDATISAADKQPKMLAALQATGIAPEKFNAIGQAAAADPALQQRIQTAASAAAPAAE